MKRVRHADVGGAGAFTLMEIMVVVAIIGLVAAMALPSILQMRKETPMRKAVNDIMEMCARARAGAVLKNTVATIIFNPRGGSAELVNGDANVALARVGGKPVMATQFDHSVIVEGLEINLNDWTEAAAAPVKFYDNGTSDEMRLFLTCGAEREVITLELTTAMPTIQQLQ